MVELHDALSAMDDWKFHEVIGNVCIPHADRRGAVVLGNPRGNALRGASESIRAATRDAINIGSANFANSNAGNFANSNAGNAANFANSNAGTCGAINRAGANQGAHAGSWVRRRSQYIDGSGTRGAREKNSGGFSS